MKVRLVIPGKAYCRNVNADILHYDRDWDILPNVRDHVEVEELDMPMVVKSKTWTKDLVWIVLERGSPLSVYFSLRGDFNAMD